MELMELPLDVVSSLVDYMVVVATNTSLLAGLELRLVNRLFDQEVQRAFYQTELVDFHSQANEKCARQMRLDVLIRIFVGRVAGPNERQNKFVQELQDGIDELVQMDEMAFIKIHHVHLDRGEDQTTWTREPQRIQIERLPILKVMVMTAMRIFSCSEVIRFLGPEFSDRDKPCSGSNWALLAAAFLGDAPTIKALMKRLPDSERPEDILNRALEIAAIKGNEDAVVIFLEANVDPSKYGSCKGHPGFGRALGYACMGGRGAIVDRLLQPCYKIERKGREYENIIFDTIRGPGEKGGGHLRMLRSLIDNSEIANLQALRFHMFGHACWWGREEVVRMVINDLQRAPTMWRGEYTLDIARSRGHTNVVQILLENGLK